MYSAITDEVEGNRITRYRITINDAAASFGQVLDLWTHEPPFRSFFTQLFAECPFSAFRWETPALTSTSADNPFEFVLLNEPRFTTRRTDPVTYKSYFTDDDSNQGIVAFANLSGDATLVVPSPRTTVDAYGHLAAFVRSAPSRQVDALWRVIAITLTRQMSNKAIWLNTAGGGVAWLHARLDSRPKYYGYPPYKKRL